MKFDLNEAIRDLLDFLKTHWKPSLAKYIIWPSMTVGLGVLSVPLWVDVANWIVTHQDYLPDYKFSITQPNYPLGISLIVFSVLVYFLDAWFKKKSNLPNQIKDLPAQVANEITTRLKSSGFTAQHLQDEKIEKLLHQITSLRFFSGFAKNEKAINLAESIIDGELCGGTTQVKARALAKLARYLSMGETVEYARIWLSKSIKLCQTEEVKIARVFIEVVSLNNVDEASSLLIDSSPASYAAFFMVKNTVDGSKAALDWFESAELNVQEFDDDGKVVLVSTLLSEHQWEKALNIVGAIDNDSTSLALAQLAAFTYLVNSVKDVELRESVKTYIPLAADKFPLADDSQSIVYRNRAIELFEICSSLARHLDVQYIENTSDNYILWLQLRDSEKHAQAKLKLQSYFINYTQKTLEYLPLAFAFGIDIDFDSIENEVNRQTALRGDNDAILGLARFVLAQTKKPFAAIVEYISEHRKQMEKSINSIAINMLEIEALARSGLVDDAEKLLNKNRGFGGA